jgi:hypothetical protein
MNSNKAVPDIVPPSGGMVEQLLNMINRLYDLIAIMMKSSTNEEINQAEVYVRLFLTEYSRLEEHLYSDKEKVRWHSNYNFLSLLRCVEQMKDTRPSRNLWEGGLCGEGYLCFVKATIKSGLRHLWQYSLMSILLRQRTILVLINEYSQRKK